MLGWLISLSTLFPAISSSQDTTIVIENTSDTLGTLSNYYKESNVFKANDSCEYELVYMTDAMNGCPGVIYYSFDHGVGNLTYELCGDRKWKKLYATENI